MLSIFQEKIPLQKFFELASKLVLDRSADLFRYLKNQRLESKPLTPTQEANAFYEVTIWEFFVFDQALMKFPDLDYLSVSDRLRAHAWWLFFDPDRAGCEELRQRSNERLREYYSFDELFIEPLSRPEFTNSTVYRCAEHIGAQFGYLKYGPETMILVAALSAHLLDTIEKQIYQTLLRKTDLRLVRKLGGYINRPEPTKMRWLGRCADWLCWFVLYVALWLGASMSMTLAYRAGPELSQLPAYSYQRSIPGVAAYVIGFSLPSALTGIVCGPLGPLVFASNESALSYGQAFDAAKRAHPKWTDGQCGAVATEAAKMPGVVAFVLGMIVTVIAWLGGPWRARRKGEN